jgi:uncharacterized SAM-binding protein YcdF (DUF218 family)
MFLFKKIVSQFFLPLPLCLMVCFTGLALLWWTKKQRAGKILVSLGLFALALLSYDAVADALLIPLERKYPAYQKSTSAPVKFVVVLGGGVNPDASLPVTSQIGDVTLNRLVEGIRIYRENPGSKLLVSGGSWLGSKPEAKIMADLAKDLGVREEEIVVEDQSRDTADQALLLKTSLGSNRFVLVTSASHMPRSMTLFRRQGMEPEAGSAEHLATLRPFQPGTLFPNGGALKRTERAFYEYMGNAVVKLRP